MEIAQVGIAISIGTLAAVIYALRLLVQIDKKLDKLLDRYR